jgi:DNA-binding beta-propeller fold protein YncE
MVRIDPRTNEVVDAIPVGRDPSNLLVHGDTAWVPNEGDGTLTELNLRTRRVHPIGRVAGVGFLARDQAGNIYSSGWDFPQVWRVSPRMGEVDAHFRVRTRAVGLAIGGGSLFVVDRLANGVTSIALAPPHRTHFWATGADPLVTAFGFGALWVANSDDASVSVIRPGDPKPLTIHVDPKPFGIATGFGSVWVGSNAANDVLRIDPDTFKVVARIPNVHGPYTIATGAGSVWAIDFDTQQVQRINPRTNRVVAKIDFRAAEPRGISIDGAQVWLTLDRPGT